LKIELILQSIKKINSNTMAVEITDSNFDELVMNSTQPVVVDFWAEWCGPCRLIGPVIEELSKEYEGRAIVGKVDVDANSEVSAKFNVRSIPTVLFIQNGVVVDKSVGAVPKATLAEKLNALLS
jgi:thioredoxin 1